MEAKQALEEFLAEVRRT